MQCEKESEATKKIRENSEQRKKKLNHILKQKQHETWPSPLPTNIQKGYEQEKLSNTISERKKMNDAKIRMRTMIEKRYNRVRHYTSCKQ